MNYENDKFTPIFYAALSRDCTNVLESSSGGVFFELCRETIQNEGFVYGAVQIDIITVEHRGTEVLEDAKAFRKSKYLKSKVDHCYPEIKRLLEGGRNVLFSGTGCQIAGLYKYLEQGYETLSTCEVVCHGIPLTEAYIKYVEEKNFQHGAEMSNINFRDKRYGWKKNAICEIYTKGVEDVCFSESHLHHSLYLKGINVEARCGNCSYAKLPRIADLTLADFWQYEGVLLEESKGKGISLVSVNSCKGSKLFQNIQKRIYVDEVTQEVALSSCRHMYKSPVVHINQEAFEKLIAMTTFRTASELCTEFGEVIYKSKLYVMRAMDKDFVIKTFMEDSQEVIYLLDVNDEIEGIVTFGAFVKSYAQGEEWINREFQKVILSDENVMQKLKGIFADNEKINRIPVTDENNKLLFEVRRTHGSNGKQDIRKQLLPFLKIAEEKRKCYFFKRPDLQMDFNYSEAEKKRIENHISFPLLSETSEYNEKELQSILKEKYSREYVTGLCEIPPIIKRGNRYQHVDGYSKYINISSGKRKTCFSPKEYEYTIHIYGRCGVFGYAVEDADTMPSKLQKLVCEKGIRVINHGTWGAEDFDIIQNLNEDLNEGIIAEQDVIILYMNYLPCIEELRQMGIYVNDTTSGFHDVLGHAGIEFYDIPGHMNAEGFAFIARYIYNELKIDLEVQRIRAKHMTYRQRFDGKMILDEKQQRDIIEYASVIKKQLAIDNLSDKRVGAVVMNCNPFTKGHRYLIEKAINEVDVLLVFIVEEDKSEFSFRDRLEMVKVGTQDLKNVHVFPSGQYVISAYTLPDYVFEGQQKLVVIDMTVDVEIFARYIAPLFNIIIRFLGTEASDEVTWHYNQTMKEILPQYGIEVREIERIKCKSRAISAKDARKFMREKKYEQLQDLLPDSTINYLKTKKDRTNRFCEKG